MTNTPHTPGAGELAAQYRGHIIALQRYLARVGTRPEVINQAVAEAVAQIAHRPDIDRPMAYLSTVARGEAERLTAELVAAEQDAGKSAAVTAPDLMNVLEQGKRPRQPKPQPKRRGRRPKAATTEQLTIPKS